MVKKSTKINPKLRIVAAVSFVVMLVVNGIAGATTWLNGINTGQVSDSFPNLFAPAGYTFGIWSVIYLLLAAYVVYQLNTKRRMGALLKQSTISAITPLFIASSLINTVWIFAWQYQVMWLSAVLIIGLLVTLILINNRLREQDFSPVERLIVKTPFSIYFGWITVATIANIVTMLVSYSWDGFGMTDLFWMTAISIIGALIGLVVMHRNRDCAYGAVFVWAYMGILVKHISESGWNQEYPVVVGMLVALISVLGAVTLYELMRVIQVMQPDRTLDASRR